MSVKLNYPYGSFGGGGSGNDPTKLPLDGGTMSVNAVVNFAQTSNKDLSIGAWGLGVEDSNGSYSTVEPTVFTQYIYPNTHPTEDLGRMTVVLKATGISATQEDGYGDNWGWSLNSFGVAGGHYDHGWYLNENGVANSGSGTPWGIGIGGVTFPDTTVQTTAASDWKDGGTANNNVSLNFVNSYTDEETGIEWTDSSVVNQYGIVSSSVNNDGYYAYAYAGSGVSFEDSNGISWSYNGLGMTINPNPSEVFSFTLGGITFIDGSTQSTAAIPEAPIDGNAYVRMNGAWVDITTL